MKWYQTLQNEYTDLIVSMNYQNLLQNNYFPSILNISTIITGKDISWLKIPWRHRVRFLRHLLRFISLFENWSKFRGLEMPGLWNLWMEGFQSKERDGFYALNIDNTTAPLSLKQMEFWYPTTAWMVVEPLMR